MPRNYEPVQWKPIRTSDEIGEILGVTPSAVTKAERRARVKIKKALLSDPAVAEVIMARYPDMDPDRFPLTRKEPCC